MTTLRQLMALADDYAREAANNREWDNRNRMDAARKDLLDNLRAYGDERARLARAAALQEAADACAAVGATLDNDWNRNLGVASGLQDACDDCADAIRALTKG